MMNDTVSRLELPKLNSQRYFLNTNLMALRLRGESEFAVNASITSYDHTPKIH